MSGAGAFNTFIEVANNHPVGASPLKKPCSTWTKPHARSRTPIRTRQSARARRCLGRIHLLALSASALTGDRFFQRACLSAIIQTVITKHTELSHSSTLSERIDLQLERKRLTPIGECAQGNVSLLRIAVCGWE